MNRSWFSPARSLVTIPTELPPYKLKSYTVFETGPVVNTLTNLQASWPRLHYRQRQECLSSPPCRVFQTECDT